jgi:hypothetical protein
MAGGKLRVGQTSKVRHTQIGHIKRSRGGRRVIVPKTVKALSSSDEEGNGPLPPPIGPSHSQLPPSATPSQQSDFQAPMDFELRATTPPPLFRKPPKKPKKHTGTVSKSCHF